VAFRRRFHCFFFSWFAAIPALGTCFQTTVKPSDPPYIPPGSVTHQAYGLTDPSGQQTALFDLAWGGTLASLKYNGVEMIWGGDPGAMVQPTFFAFPNPTGLPYNPEQAGGNPLDGTPTLGAGCTDSNTLLILSGTTDYFIGQSGYKVANPVIAGAIYQHQFTTPYTITTTARFVQNPGGTPAYYLKITQSFLNNHPVDSLSAAFVLALYVPYSFQNFISSPPGCLRSSMCPLAGTASLVEGMYQDAAHTQGTALFFRPAQWLSLAPGGSIFAYGGPPNPLDPRGIGSGAYITFWHLPPNSVQTYDFFVLVGGWTAALSFATSP